MSPRVSPSVTKGSNMNMAEFTVKIEKYLKSNADHTRYYYRFKTDDGITKRGIFDYTKLHLDPDAADKKAKMELYAKQEERSDNDIEYDRDSTLDTLAKVYFKQHEAGKDWINNLRSTYSLYVGDCRSKEEIKEDLEKDRVLPTPTYKIGSKKIKDIRKSHIDNIRTKMGEAGNSPQTINGCSNRTRKKVLAQILKPILEYAKDDGILDNVPKIVVPKQPKTKSISKPIDKLSTVYKTLKTLYSNDPFYMSFFLFALFGRRLNEIITLTWDNIDFDTNTYMILAEHNKINEDQEYTLPAELAENLHKIKDNGIGLVFKSSKPDPDTPASGKAISSPKRQMAKIKELSGIENLTIHLFRHIYISVAGKSELGTHILSAALGHTNPQALKHYLTTDTAAASAVANEIVEAEIQ